MLSLTNVTAQQAENYYEKDNYYAQAEGKANSQWFGKGAEELGLRGEVKAADFKQLLAGYGPDEQQLKGRYVDHKTHQDGHQNRAGVDLTFSAPKSVSVALLVGGDERLLDAHERAVERTLQVIEERYAKARVIAEEGRESVATGNLVIARFAHDTSREKDPQLHTHAVVLNATQLADGQWRALSNEELYNQKMFLGQVYRNELAHEVQKLGYSINVQEKGFFELQGYSQEQLAVFSKRSEQIRSTGAVTAEEKAQAAVETRAPKGQIIKRESLREYWQAQATEAGIRHPVPSKKGMEHESKAYEAIERAIGHYSEREVAFKRESVERFALQNHLGQQSWSELQSAFRGNQELLKANDGRYTTTWALKRELDTIALVEQGKGRVGQISTGEQVSHRLEAFEKREGKTLNEGQRKAIELAATSQDRFMAIQGVAGAGKSFSLQGYREIAETQGYTVRGFAPSAEAAKVLGEEAGLKESKTVASLLHSRTAPQSSQSDKREVWIVDEAGLLSAKDAHALLLRANEEGARVVLVGDTRQLSAVEAGNPFRSLQANGIQTAYLEESQRQKSADLKEAVQLFNQGRTSEGLQKIDHRIVETQSREERLEQVVQGYLSMPSEQREKTLVLAGTNANRLELTLRIREGLKSEGSLGESLSTSQLKKKDMSEVQSGYAHSYSAGDVVVPVSDYKRLGLVKAERYTVEGSSGDLLTLRDAEGRPLEVDPGRFKKNVYSVNRIEVAEGDQLRWSENQNSLGRRNGQQFTLARIDAESGQAQIRYSNGKSEQVDLKEMQHLDYALVSTTYSSQGKTANTVLVFDDQAISQEAFYVNVTRARYDLRIYTEDRQELLEKAQHSRSNENPKEVLLGVFEKEQSKAKAQREIPALEKMGEGQKIEKTQGQDPIEEQSKGLRML